MKHAHLRARFGRGHRLVAWLTLVSGLLGFAGCAGQMTVLQTDGTRPAAASPVAPREHGTGVLGVEFDPPLDRAVSLGSGRGVTLLAAVENEGLSDEHDVRVTARLLDISSGAPYRELLYGTVVLEVLSPGEVRLVRFPEVSALPLSLSRYRLRAEIQPVPGEDDLANNARSYDLVPGAGG